MTLTKKRRELITNTVSEYIRNYPLEYLEFKKYMKIQRVGMANERLGIVREDVSADKNSAMRNTFRMPTRLADRLFSLEIEPHFMETANSNFSRKEEAWFAKKYPEFLLPQQY